jgi:phenylacetate-CoA ligase
MYSSAFYRHSPVWLQEVLVSARAGLRKLVREGASFRGVISEIGITQNYDLAQLQTLQLEKIRALFGHVYLHVPYYTECFKKAGISAEDIKSLEDVRILPYLTKPIVVSRRSDFLAKNIRGPRIPINTSGSTGTPLQMFQNLEAVIRENAFIWRQLQWAGFERGQRRAWMRGDMVVPFESNNRPFWRKNFSEDMLMMSSYHLSESTAQDYVGALEQYDPVLIQAYPSAISYLARYLAAEGRDYTGPSLAAIVTSSETLTGTDRDVIESRFGCKVFDYYGSAERVTMIQTCEHGRYHLASDYAFTELIPLEDGTSEIVGTGFNNWLMPLIRYRSGDTVEMDRDGTSCPCGRRLPLVKQINGRSDDYLKTRDGRRIGRLDHIFKGVKNVAEGQLVQNRLDEVIIRVVPFAGFGKADRTLLIANAHERLGGEMRIEVEVISAIPRTKNGKFRAVICNV